MLYPQQQCRLVGCAPEDHLDPVTGVARRLRREDGAGLDEELGADRG